MKAILGPDPMGRMGSCQCVAPNRRSGVRGRRPDVGQGAGRDTHDEPRITAIGERTGTEWWSRCYRCCIGRCIAFSVFFLLLSLGAKFKTWERMWMCCQTFVATSGEMVVEVPWRPHGVPSSVPS
jgi:hypothetical protein